jgi:hypothetical protein
MPERAPSEVLVAGIYLCDQPTHATAIVNSFSQAREYSVSQRWVAIGEPPEDSLLASVTVQRLPTPAPKFVILNSVLGQEDLDRYDYVILCDDDVELPDGFVDDFLGYVRRFGFSLAQPARTRDSYIDHLFVAQLDGVLARQTRFVEIGPVLALSREVVPLLVPFDAGSGMGWGYDFAWPNLLERRSLALGIVDATPVRHALRKPVTNYDALAEREELKPYLRRTPHLTPLEAFQIVKTHA